MNSKIIINPQHYVDNVIKLLLDDKIIVFPTDTCYGLVAVFSPENQKNINLIKKRKIDIKIPILYVNPKSLSFILLKDREKLNTIKLASKTCYVVNEHINAVRLINDNKYNLAKIIRMCGPLLASSFNFHGKTTISNLAEIEKTDLHGVEKVFFFPDYKSEKSSRIINLNNMKIIRK